MLDRVRLTACDGILASVCRSWPAGHAIIEHPAHPETIAATLGKISFYLTNPLAFGFRPNLRIPAQNAMCVCHIVFFVPSRD